MSYSDQLRDPRWQKKRLEALHESGWECEECGSKTTELHVHHRRYLRGAKPWDYGLENLEVLCKDCHKRVELLKDELNDGLAMVQLECGGLGMLVGLMSVLGCGPLDSSKCRTYEEAEGIGIAFGLDAEEVIDCSNDSIVYHTKLYEYVVKKYSGKIPKYLRRRLPWAAKASEKSPKTTA